MREFEIFEASGSGRCWVSNPWYDRAKEKPSGGEPNRNLTGEGAGASPIKKDTELAEAFGSLKGLEYL